MFSKITKTFGVKLVSAILNFLIAVVVSQYLGASGKGEQGIIITTITLVLLFSNIVGGASLVYLTPRLPVKKIMLLSYGWTILTSILFIFVLTLFPLAEKKHTLHIVLLACMNSFIAINASVLLGKENIRGNNYVIFFQILVTILTLLFYFMIMESRSVSAYITSLYVAYGCAFFISIFFLFPYLGKKAAIENDSWNQSLKMLFRYGFVNQLSHIAQLLSFRVSYYFLDFYHGYQSVGIYSNGVSVTESVWMIAGSIALVQYSKISNTGDKTENQHLTKVLLRISLFVTFLVLIPLVLLPSAFYTFIFGKDFFEVNKIILCLAPGILVYVNALILGHYFSGTGKYHINTIGSTIGLLVTFILALILIPLYSSVGAAITATASYFATSLFIIFYFCHESNSKLYELFPMPRHISEYLASLKKLLSGIKAKSNE